MPVVTATPIANLLIGAEDDASTTTTTIKTQTKTDTTNTETDTETDTKLETTQRKGVVAAETTTTTTPTAKPSSTAGAIDDAKDVKAKCSSAGWTSTECQNQSQGWIETHWWAFIVVGVGLIVIVYLIYKWFKGRKEEKRRKESQQFELDKARVASYSIKTG